MKKAYSLLLIGFLISTFLPSDAFAATQTLLSDPFSSGTRVSATRWHIPTWTSPTDGTYIGRTQMRVSQDYLLPTVSNGAAQVLLSTYNPSGSPVGTSFLGTDLISNQQFSLGTGLNVRVRARMNSVTPGVVGGIFLYNLKPGSNTLHDEIDYEILGTHPSDVQTNIYANELLGAGHTQFVPLSSGGGITSYHTYEMQWRPGNVTWLLDGAVVRTTTQNVPSDPMYLHLNAWAPDQGWGEAYSATLQPARSSSGNRNYTMQVDSVVVESVDTPPPPPPTPILTSITLSPTNSALTTGQAVQLTASPLDQFGQPIAVTPSWSSSNPAVASVSASGLVTALSAGSAGVTATSGGVSSAPVSVTVTNPVPPGIAITSVPPLGFSGSAQGTVVGVTPSQYAVALYIKVGNGWWTKPTYAYPLTSIASNGSWSGNITTGGSDIYATEVRAYLVPAGTAVPLSGGASSLPAGLSGYPFAVAYR